MNQKLTLRLFFLVLLLGMGSYLSAAEQAGGFNVRIRVEGIADTTCYLGYHFGDKQYLRDTVEVDGQGWMTFQSDTLLDGGIYLCVLPDKNYFEFIVGDDQEFTMETSKTNLVANMKTKGTEENKIFYDYLQFLDDQRKAAEGPRKKMAEDKDDKKAQEELAEIDTKVKNYQKNLIQTHKNLFVSKLVQSSQEIEIPDTPEEILSQEKGDSLEKVWRFEYYRDHFFDYIDFSDDRMLRTPILHQKMVYFVDKLTYQVPDSLCKATEFIVEKARANDEVFRYAVITLTNKYATSKVMGFDAVYVCMAEKYYLTKQAWWADSTMLDKIYDRVVKIKPNILGVRAKNICMKDMYGDKACLYDVKSDYTILVFWDATCGHCKKEVPQLHQVYQKFKEYNVKAFAVSNEITNEKWLEFIEEHNMGDWINAIDLERQSPFRQYYDIYSTPVLYLLDKDKDIILKRVSHDQIDEYLSNEFDLPYEKPEPEEKEEGDGSEDNNTEH